MLQSLSLRLLLFNFIFVCQIHVTGQVKVKGTAVDFPGDYVVVQSLSMQLRMRKNISINS
jgi:hypothetical protein